MKLPVTLETLVDVLSEGGNSPSEVTATALHMVRSGAVELVGERSLDSLIEDHANVLNEMELAA